MQCDNEGNLCELPFNCIGHKNKLLFHEQMQCVFEGNIFELLCNQIGHKNHLWKIEIQFFRVVLDKVGLC